jgi:glycosyltransferase involved in cell wall biosynthesis
MTVADRPEDGMAADAPLHVVHIISGLGQGGAETVLYRLVTAPGQSVRHTVVSLTDEGVFGPRLRDAGIPVAAMGMKRGPAALRGLVSLHRLLRREAPDVVQTWMYHADLIGGVAARLAGVRAVAWGIRNSGASLGKGSRLARVVAWLCARLSGTVPAAIIACAQNAALRHKQWGYAADKLCVIQNGYDFSRWHADAEARRALRSEWGVSESAPLIGSVARWNPLKDHANLFAALARCAQDAPALRCVLAGLGMDASNGELMALADRHGVRDKLVLLGPRQDIPRIMSAIDVHVLSSCAEGFPNVVAEAMATGPLCVVTDVGDAAVIVGDNGWVVPPSDSQALAHAISAAVATLESEAAAGMSQRARDSVVRRFGLGTMTAAYDQVWRRLARDRAVAGAAGRQSVDARRLLMVVNNPAFFLSHRLPLALAARRAGFEVHVATMDGPSVPRIVSLGLTYHVIPMSRSGKNPFQELQSLFALWRLFRRLRPDLVHAVTIKPVLYGGIAARLARVPAFVAAVSGLGYVFMRDDGGFDPLRSAAVFLYKLALGHRNSRVVFQNTADRDVLRRAGVVREGQAVLIRGSGVDLDLFAASDEPDGPVRAVMASRLLRDKGVEEFVEAARLSAARHTGVRWVLAGSVDPGNPASVSADMLAAWLQEDVVDYLGEQDDVAALYRDAHIAVLPSYREGLPKSLIEAAACARPVVTTDVPGCRDAIEADVTGLLVPARDAGALAEAVLRLAGDPELRRKMGAAGRDLAEREFDVRKVEQAHLAIYEVLTVPPPGA